jgi:hypothetical protein
MRRGVNEPIHYRAWYELLLEEGVTATGKDPLATFLTQITRSPVVARVAGASGIYQLDPHGAYEHARVELADANRALTLTREQSGAGEERLSRARARLDQAKQQLNAVLHARSALLQARLTAPRA